MSPQRSSLEARERQRKAWAEAFAAIQSHMKQADDPSREYICKRGIRDSWSRETIRCALYSAQLSNEELEVVFKDLLGILSIMVSIRAEDYVDENFRSLFLPLNNGRLKHNDEELPMTQEKLSFIGEPRIEKLFLQEQFVFTPVGKIASSVQPNGRQR
jgi:hypothetical protein